MGANKKSLKNKLLRYSTEYTLLLEIKRLRSVLHDIASSQPNEDMDIEREPVLTKWICDTCMKARIGAYPSDK